MMKMRIAKFLSIFHFERFLSEGPLFICWLKIGSDGLGFGAFLIDSGKPTKEYGMT